MTITKINSRHFTNILIDDPNFTGCCEDSMGDRGWYKNGRQHREDGPCGEYITQGCSDTYALDGDYCSEANWEHKVLNYKMKRIINK
jgi:hypothetical protein